MTHAQECSQVCVQQQYNENCPTSQQHGHFPTKIYEYSTAVKMNKLQLLTLKMDESNKYIVEPKKQEKKYTTVPLHKVQNSGRAK